MIAIYHSRDLDGICSGAILKKRYPEAKIIGYDYGEPIPAEIIPDEDLIIADVSFPVPLMVKISQQQRSFIWIDHHVSAATEFLALEDKGHIEFIYDSRVAACELTWKYCFPDTPIPPAVLLLGEYDSWRNQDTHRGKTAIIPFQWGMRILCNSVETFPTEAFGSPIASAKFIQNTIVAGESVLRYQKLQDARACKGAFEAVFEGHPSICLNKGLANSLTFESVWDPEKHHIMIPFSFNKNRWIVSLFTTRNDVDCSLIASQWGGGGHRKAAGFSVTDIRKVFPNI
jgi:oligoribonuclease NrnB/cAMP/cGMP phosphodiesterase (DHH superfamily)